MFDSMLFRNDAVAFGEVFLALREQSQKTGITAMSMHE
jgi:hypothetical protein